MKPSTLLWFLLFYLFVFPVACALPDEKSPIFTLASLFVLNKRSIEAVFENDPPPLGYDRGKPRRRVRKLVNDVFDELGPGYMRRAYRMDQQSFWKLFHTIKPYMLKSGSLEPKKGSTKKHKNGAVNGIIGKSVRLAAALRFFAGGDPYDIMTTFGIGHTDVYNSVWMVVDAVNNCPALAISFPKDHGKQRQMAKQFQEKSDPGFECCVGAIDGVLIWIEKPNAGSCELAKTGQLAFFCGRKHKYGINMQAVCDSFRRFMDIDLSMPGKTSDYLARVHYFGSPRRFGERTSCSRSLFVWRQCLREHSLDVHSIQDALSHRRQLQLLSLAASYQH